MKNKIKELIEKWEKDLIQVKKIKNTCSSTHACSYYDGCEVTIFNHLKDLKKLLEREK